MKKPRRYLQDVTWVDFYQRPIITGFDDEFGYVVPMKPIVEDHLGLNWSKVREKLNSSVEIGSHPQTGAAEVNLFNPVLISGQSFSDEIDLSHEYPDEDIPVFLPNQEYLCLPVDELNLFLCQISIRHVSLESRETLYQYQKECGQALHDYWFGGFAINNRQDPSRVSCKRHDWCPRQLSSQALTKACERYSVFAQKHFDSRLNPDDIKNYCINVISDILMLESESWEGQTNAVAFNIAFMERACFDILYFAIEGNVNPEDLQNVLERNIINAWENVGNLVLAVQSPFNPFPGIGRGAAREMV